MTATGGSGTLPTVVIVGAGAAGIFAAYQINKHWPGQFDVQLFKLRRWLAATPRP